MWRREGGIGTLALLCRFGLYRYIYILKQGEKGSSRMDNRKHMGKNKDRVIFPIAPNLSEMSDSYMQFIEEIKA